MILFTTHDCPKCDYIKSNIDFANTRITIKDVTTEDGLAILAWHELVADAEKQLPILLLEDSSAAITDYDDILKHLGINKQPHEECEDDNCSL